MLRNLFPILILISLFSSCAKENTQANNPVPYVTVNRQINIDNPQYIQLNQPGGYVYLDGEGYKGIVVIRDYADQFLAFDRACTYHPGAACAKLIMDKSALNLICGHYDGNDFEPCCDSKFSTQGAVNNGPATYPLKQYYVSQSGSVLSISNF
jgi:Rieske Fe-S protein